MITIQPKAIGGQLPVPYEVDMDNDLGAIGNQGYWKGKPARLLGFSRNSCVNHLDVTLDEFDRNITVAVGLYMVTEDQDGTKFTHSPAVLCVSV
jgi:hypothetical protein